MTPNDACPFCGSSLESTDAILCPSCGSALPGRGSSAPTLISSKPISKQSEFNNSAEAMDEIKKLLSEGDSAGATSVAATEFGLDAEGAKTTIDQVGIDMQHSGGGETLLAGSSPADRPASRPIATPPAPEVIIPESYGAPEKPNNRRTWIIGGSIGAAIFLCLCCCLPLVLIVLNMGPFTNQ